MRKWRTDGHELVVRQPGWMNMLLYGQKEERQPLKRISEAGEPFDIAKGQSVMMPELE